MITFYMTISFTYSLESRNKVLLFSIDGRKFDTFKKDFLIRFNYVKIKIIDFDY